ncbi:MAG: selenide, water dikinase SelD, partial [Bacteroidota bacterium]
SHGAGCGCKLSPAILGEILSGSASPFYRGLLVGNENKDDAAVYQIDEQSAIISTTDFFMPIVDDPHDFGGIAATNAISDVYAMGGTPLMAIAILGWPVKKLSSQIAKEVLEGGKEACERAGIPLAGGHSIDAPEPIFGLAVTGKANLEHIKTNGMAQPGDLIYLTKPLGIGMITTAQKKGYADEEDLSLALQSMLKLNDLGAKISQCPYVHALTDVTGFGFGGHLLEVLEASEVGAEIHAEHIPKFPFVDKYLKLGAIPGGTQRNWDSYGGKINFQNGIGDHRLLADPQTSGGLLVTIHSKFRDDFEHTLSELGYEQSSLGRITAGPVNRIQVIN